MSIKRALGSILEGNLDEMRQNFSSALTTKAVEKLEERKIEIAKNYFGQMQEGKEDPSKKLKTLDAERREAGRRANVRNTPEYRQKKDRHKDLEIMRAGRVIASQAMREDVEQVDEALPMDYWRLSGKKNKTLTTKNLNNAIDRAFAKKNNVNSSQKKTTPKAKKKG